MKLLNRRRERQVANAVIADPEDHTTMDRSGAVRSIQAANVDLPEDELDKLWSAASLERLARTYWWFLSRVTLGLIRVHYSEEERAVVLITRPFVLLRFRPPTYDLSSDRGVVQWQIRDGLLVGRKDEGYLEIDVRRCESEHEGYGRAARRGRGRELLPRPRAAVQVVLRQHAVAHPRDRHARLPAAARAAGARGVRRRALRRAGRTQAPARGRQRRVDAVADRRCRWRRASSRSAGWRA